MTLVVRTRNDGMGKAILVLAVIVAGCGSPPPDTAAASAPNLPASSAADSAAGQTSALPKVAGAPQQNSLLRLEAIEAGFFPMTGSPAPGRRYFTVGLRGTSQSASGQLLGASKGDDVMIDVRRFVFAQNERGCISRPEFGVAGVANTFGESMTFAPARPSVGRLVFLVPEDTQKIRVLIAPAGADRLAVPAGDDFKPAWPQPLHTIEDGTTMKILVLPTPSAAAGLPPTAAGREFVMLDVVVQNLSADHGIEFQPSQQLRLMDAGGTFVMASAATRQLGCHMEDNDVIPPGHSRRLMAVYERPVNERLRLHYRGFEKEEAIVDIRQAKLDPDR